MTTMIFILTILFLVGVIGLQWVDNMDLKQRIYELTEDYNDVTCELDPIEVYSLRTEESESGESTVYFL